MSNKVYYHGKLLDDDAVVVLAAGQGNDDAVVGTVVGHPALLSSAPGSQLIERAFGPLEAVSVQ